MNLERKSRVPVGISQNQLLSFHQTCCILFLMPRTTVEFFVNSSGESPIREFIDRCPDRQQAKILRLLQHLQEFGLTVAVPNTKKLKGTPLWELRILGRDNIRIIYAPLGKSRVVILHIFLKRTRKTPRKEISTAMKRYQQLLDR